MAPGGRSTSPPSSPTRTTRTTSRECGRARFAQRMVAIGVRTRFMSARSNDRRPIFASEIGEHPKGRKIDDQIGQRTLDMRRPGLAPGPVDVQAAWGARRGAGVGVAEVAAIGDDAGAFAMDGAHDFDDALGYETEKVAKDAPFVEFFDFFIII